jgi:hypothetical protein
MDFIQSKSETNQAGGRVEQVCSIGNVISFV